MNIALVTGASTGIGREFVRQIGKKYKQLDEIWVIARNEKKLRQLKEEMANKVKLCPIPLDLAKEDSLISLKEKLKKENPKIRMLVNGAGMGRIGRFSELPLEEQLQTVRLNCEALTGITHLTIPYMRKGSRIIQVASGSAFSPQPEFSVYAASKAYVVSFSRALRRELEGRQIKVSIVAPGPVDTPFFEKAETFQKIAPFKKNAMAKPEEIVRQALKDGVAGREWSIYGGKIKAAGVLCKVFPHGWIMKGMKLLNG